MESLPNDWPFLKPERFAAVDGQHVPPPAWWRGGTGAWGCYRSHLAILEKCLNEEFHSALILEDDAICCDNFATNATAFLDHLPADWGLIYFGGQHISINLALPVAVNEQVYRPFNVNRTHAFAYRGQAMMRRVYQHLTEGIPWQCRHHVDHRLGELHKELPPGIYVPRQWLIVQRGGASDVSYQDLDQTDFQGAKSLCECKIKLPVALVLGDEQPSCRLVAGALHLLGVSMGRFKYDDPLQCSFRGAQLRSICNSSFQPPLLIERLDTNSRQRRLRVWASSKSYEHRNASMFGGYHPSLPLLAADLCAVTDQARLVVVDNKIGLPESLADSLELKTDAKNFVQTKLQNARHRFINQAHVPICRIDSKQLLTNPEVLMCQLIDELSLSPLPEQRATAVNFLLRTFNLDRDGNHAAAY